MALSYDNPQTNGYLFAAYRPIPVTVTDGGSGGSSVPVVYLDVYINTVYYKTYSNTSPTVTISYSGGHGIITRRWQFDLQDCLQEYLSSNPAPLIGGAFVSDSGAVCSFYTMMRGSSYDVNGFVVPDSPVPIQGNYDADPVAGGGTSGLTFCASNSTLQHEDNQSLTAHLAAFVYPTASIARMIGLPLTHRPTDGSLIASPGQYGQFPLLFPLGAYYGANTTAATVDFFMDWQEIGNPAVLFRKVTAMALFSIFPAPVVIDFPIGLANLDFVPWDAGSTVPDYNKIYQYRIYARESTYNDTFFVSGWISTPKKCTEARLHFLNSVGGFDAVNFQYRTDLLEVKSSQYQRGLPRAGLQRSSFGHQRFGVSSNEKVTVTTADYPEQYQSWLKELLDSPRVYVEVQSQGDALPDLIPVIVADGEFVLKNAEDRFVYQFSVTYQPSNENIRQRG